MRIAIIEDNESVAKGIAFVLRDAGHAVDLIHDGLEADAHLRGDGADVLILDINLPGMSGIGVLKNLRKRQDDRPVLLLTARGSTEERIEGLDAGADDYLVKPFEMAELEARIRAMARRRAVPVVQTMTVGGLRFDPQHRQVQHKGQVIDLPRKERVVDLDGESVPVGVAGHDVEIVAPDQQLVSVHEVAADGVAGCDLRRADELLEGLRRLGNATIDDPELALPLGANYAQHYRHTPLDVQ